jgi:hypothetical protein
MPLNTPSLIRASILMVGTSASWTQSNSEHPPKPPASCPVTKSDAAFAPPAPYRSAVGGRSFFFGTPRLWTLVHEAWTPTKLVWWNPPNEKIAPEYPRLIITLTRLDAQSPALQARQPNWGYIEGQPLFLTSGFDAPPTAGCWEVAGRIGNDEVKYVVWLGAQ